MQTLKGQNIHRISLNHARHKQKQGQDQCGSKLAVLHNITIIFYCQKYITYTYVYKPLKNIVISTRYFYLFYFLFVETLHVCMYECRFAKPTAAYQHKISRSCQTFSLEIIFPWAFAQCKNNKML